MLKKSTKEPQLEMFKTVLETLVNPSHELCLLGKQRDWDSMETEFAHLWIFRSKLTHLGIGLSHKAITAVSVASGSACNLTPPLEIADF